ncbi:MAG: DUF4465 domain-containing protein [Rikenellaceae bacterium]
MKKIFFLLAFAATIFSCSDNDSFTASTQKFAILTFEDADYKGTGNYLGSSDWSSLIGDQYYGSSLLYGTYDTDLWCYFSDYNWYDEGNTELASELLSGAYGKNYSAGGHAISNYYNTDASLSYDIQLSVSVGADGQAGHKNSNNFAMCYGYTEDLDYNSETELPYIYFKDGVERTIEFMYVVPSTLAIDFMKNGDYQTTITADDYVTLTAIGYDLDGNVTGTVSVDFLRDGVCLEEWTLFHLKSLGKVASVKFNISGTPSNSRGFNVPSYFAYDNITVRMDE